jgi:hypothetical protein
MIILIEIKSIILMAALLPKNGGAPTMGLFAALQK